MPETPKLMPLHEIAKELKAVGGSSDTWAGAAACLNLAYEVERHATQQLDRETATLNAAAAAVRDMAEQRPHHIPCRLCRESASTLAMAALDMGMPGRFVELLRVRAENYGAGQREQGHQQGRAEALRSLGTALGTPV